MIVIRMLTKILSLLSIVTIITALPGSVLATPPARSVDLNPTTPVTSDTPKPLEKKDIDVIVYSSKNCHSCTSVKELFEEKKINYTEINVDNNPAKLKELEEKTGKKTVPQVMVNGKHVGGYLKMVWGDGMDEILKNKPTSLGK